MIHTIIFRRQVFYIAAIDADGFGSKSLPFGPLPWAQIESCACKNIEGRRILRIFLSPGALDTPKPGDEDYLARPVLRKRGVLLIKRDGSGYYFDIDFAGARNPEATLETVFRACAERIAQSREWSAPGRAMRAFVDERPDPRPNARRSWKRVVFLLALFPLAAVAFAFGVRRPVIEEPPGAVDSRPGQSILFLGNSRVVANDLPRMVRDVADSANSPIRYDVHMRAWAAATLREHLDDDGDRAELRKPWDMVILQPQSGAFESQAIERDFVDAGAKLIREAQESGSHVAVMANWTLGPSHFNGEDRAIAGDPRSYGRLIDEGTRSLAEPMGAGIIELQRAFEDAEDAEPHVALTTDGNHPSHAGTYLAALVIYRFLSHDNLEHVSYRPYDMTPETAAKLKRVAMRYAD